MSRFTVPLRVTPMPDGRTWCLLTPFAYEVRELGSGDLVEVPRGFLTDFASVPRPVWWFAAPWGRHGHAAVIHDVLYWRQDRSRRESDQIFLEAMEVSQVGAFKRRAMWAAVRIGGYWAWRANATRDKALKIIDPDTIGMAADVAVEQVQPAPVAS